VIAACFLSVGLLLIAAFGGGLTEVALALVAEAVLAAALVTMISRPRPRPAADSSWLGGGDRQHRCELCGLARFPSSAAVLCPDDTLCAWDRPLGAEKPGNGR
jgi:hypothetical protein